MTAKPIVDIVHRGQSIRIDFDKMHGLTIKYVIAVDGKQLPASFFAEEVMRWLGERMNETKR